MKVAGYEVVGAGQGVTDQLRILVWMMLWSEDVPEVCDVTSKGLTLEQIARIQIIGNCIKTM